MKDVLIGVYIESRSGDVISLKASILNFSEVSMN